MTYVKVSIPKASDGAGAAAIKKPTVILIDVDDVATEPSREVGSAVVSGNITLKTGAKAVGIYATPSSIAITRESNGEVDARSLIKGLEYNHPGDSDAIESHLEGFLNKGVIALVTECDGSAGGRVRMVGSVCNPLYLQPEYTNNNEAASNRFVWKQAQGDKFGVATYTGTLPTIASDGTGSGSGDSA